MLDANLKTQLQAYLEKAIYPIEISVNVGGSAAAEEMQGLLNDIAELSDKITLKETSDASVRAPSFALNRSGSNMGIRFAGIPMGHEFTSLILALLQVGGHPPK